MGGCRLGAGSGCRYQEGYFSVPCGLLDGAPARFVPGRRSSCDCSGFASGATGSREFSLVALAGLGRPSLATWRRRLRGRFTRRVPGRVPGPLRSAGTGRFVGAPHSAPVRRWPSRRDAGWRTARRPRPPRCVRTVRCARCAGVRGHCPRCVLAALEVAVLGAFLKLGVCVRAGRCGWSGRSVLKRRRTGCVEKGVLLGVDSVLIGVLLGAVARVAYCLAARGCCSMRAAGASARISTDARRRVRAHRHCRRAAVCAPRGGYPVACRLAPERRSVLCGQLCARGGRPARCGRVADRRGARCRYSGTFAPTMASPSTRS